MKQEERQFLLQAPQRCAVVYARLAGCDRPFVIMWPEVSWRAISAAELKGRMQQSAEELGWVAEREDDDAEPSEQKELGASASPRPGLKALNYLKAATTFHKSATDLDKLVAQVSTWAGNQLRNELEKLGLVKVHRVSTGKRGGILTLVEVTSSGYECLKEMGVEAARLPGKGGFLHQWWQSVICEHCKRNFPNALVDIEDFRFGKAVDIGVHTRDKSIAFEVFHSGVQKELKNVLADSVHYDEVYICCDSPAAVERLQAAVRSDLGDEWIQRVRWKLLGSFLG